MSVDPTMVPLPDDLMNGKQPCHRQVNEFELLFSRAIRRIDKCLVYRAV
jgi:hypothetical protein